MTGGPCIEWPGSVDRDGYGKCGGRQAHRVVWELVMGLRLTRYAQLDHLCRNRLCVNPAHLEPVTPRENARRRNATITHCPHGHPYDEANTRITPKGHRRCRRCHQLGKRGGRGGRCPLGEQG